MMTEQPQEPVGGTRTIRTGLAVVAIAFGGFGTWAATAPLNSAAVAHGEVKVETYRKTIQHREGGIVRAVLVADGDRVTAGQPLLQLDDTSIRARWTQLKNQYWDQLGNKARLTAERDGSDTIDFAAAFAGEASPRVDEIRHTQENLFHARRDLLAGQVAVLNKRIDSMRREADSVEAERQSKDRQLAIIREELGTVEQLVQRGLDRRPRLLQLRREAERLQGERDDHGASIARISQSIAGTELDIANIRSTHLQQVAADLDKAGNDIRDLEQQITAAEDALTRTIIRAPKDGVVVGLKVHTVGQVLQPGEDVMDVVPAHDGLIVEARVQPEDIDRVHVGVKADVRLHSFVRSLTPPVKGTVTQVSADLMRDPRNNNQAYYLARIALDPQGVGKLPGPLTPGMQGDVLISTGERSALEYLLAPLSRAMAVAMRER